MSELDFQAQLELTMRAGEWLPILKILKTTEREYVVFRRLEEGLRCEALSLDHVFMVSIFLNLYGVGKHDELVILIDRTLDFIRHTDRKTPVSYGFKPIGEGEGVVNITSRGELGQQVSFKLIYSPSQPFRALPPTVASAVVNTKLLAELAGRLRGHDSIQLLFEPNQIRAVVEGEDSELVFSIPAAIDSPCSSHYNGTRLYELVRYLPMLEKSDTTTLSMLSDESKNHVLSIRTPFRSGEVASLLAPRVI